MQISDILRKVADIVDQAEDVSADAEAMPAEQPGAEGGAEIKIAQLEPVEVDGEDGTESETMVSPLQQEHELLKKSQGVDNNVDQFAEEEGEVEEDDSYNDELAQMKKMAGIGEEEVSRDVSDNLRPASLNPRANAALEANGKEHLKHTQRKDF